MSNVSHQTTEPPFLMSTSLAFPALFVGFVAASGFLFGQLFSGHFTVAATLAGVAGLFCSFSAFKMAAQHSWAPAWVYFPCFLALLGVAMDAANYYLYLAIPGNYYAWPLIGPFVACIALIAFITNRRRASTVRTDA